MKQLNVFDFDFASWRYPSNWLRNAKTFCRSFKWAWQRATRGYCDLDTWDLDRYYLHLFTNTLNQFASEMNGWPGEQGGFESFDEWQRYVRDMAKKFYMANEDNDFYPHPKTDEWIKSLDGHYADFIKTKADGTKVCTVDVDKARIDEELDNQEKRERDFAEAWSMMGNVFWHLWW